MKRILCVRAVHKIRSTGNEMQMSTNPNSPHTVLGIQCVIKLLPVTKIVWEKLIFTDFKTGI